MTRWKACSMQVFGAETSRVLSLLEAVVAHSLAQWWRGEASAAATALSPGHSKCVLKRFVGLSIHVLLCWWFGLPWFWFCFQADQMDEVLFLDPFGDVFWDPNQALHLSVANTVGSVGHRGDRTAPAIYLHFFPQLITVLTLWIFWNCMLHIDCC